MSWVALFLDTLADRLWMIALGLLPAVLLFWAWRRVVGMRPQTACACASALLASMLLPLVLPVGRTVFRFEQAVPAGGTVEVTPAGAVGWILRCPLPTWLLFAPPILMIGFAILRASRRDGRDDAASSRELALEVAGLEVAGRVAALGLSRRPRVRVVRGSDRRRCEGSSGRRSPCRR